MWNFYAYKYFHGWKYPYKEISEDKIYICEVNIFLKNAKHSFEKIQKNILHFLLKNIFNFGLPKFIKWN
ncbi:MAG TPA: hypothetical protein DCG69_10480 [Bacteroidales bacterium]|nr:hypothetical protein [Bacteroidales bacterium]